MKTDRQILAAWAVAEWRTALDHLEALTSMGFDAAHEASVVRAELQRMAEKFMVMIDRGVGYTDDQLAVAVREARSICTAHQGRLNVLLNREKG